MEAAAVDHAGFRLRDGVRRDRDDPLVRRLALVPGQDLRVVDPLGVEPIGQHDGGGHERPGQRAAAGLVRARDAGEPLLAQRSFVPDQVAAQSIPPILPGGHAITNASPITFSSGM